MIEINLENMRDVETKDIGGKRCLITLTNTNAAKIEIIMTKEHGSWIYDSLERICVAPEYWYEEMQAEIDRLTQENEDLREENDNLSGGIIDEAI